MTFGEKLLALRKQQDMSQEDLAEKLEASRTTVSRWETDQSMPEIDKLLAISKLFCVSVDYLLKDKPTDRIAMQNENDPDNTGNMETVKEFISLKWLFWICTAINALGFTASMYGWHRLQSPFFVLMGLSMNTLACLFFKIFHPRQMDRAMAQYIDKRFYAANLMILLPTPIYIIIEIISFGEHYAIIAPHMIPFAIYILAGVGVIIYLIRQNKK